MLRYRQHKVNNLCIVFKCIDRFGESVYKYKETRENFGIAEISVHVEFSNCAPLLADLFLCICSLV